MIALVLATLISSSAQAAAVGPVVVLVSGREGVDAPAAQNLAEAVSAALGREGFKIAASPQAAATKLKLAGADPASCAGRPDCLGLLGQSFAPAMVVGLQVGKLGKKFAVQLSAVRGTGEVAADHSFVLAAAKLDRPSVKEPVAAFAKKLKAWVAKNPNAFVVEAKPPEPRPTPDIPPPELRPLEPPIVTLPPPVVVREAPAPVWPKYTALALGVVAAGAAGYGVYEGVTSLNQGDGLKGNAEATADDWAAAGAHAQRADIAYGSAGVLVVAAILLLVLSPRNPTPATGGAGSSGAATGWSF